MDIKEIEEKVMEVLADRASMDVKQVTLQSRLVDDLGLDSLDAVEIVFQFEENYGIDIPDDQIREFKTAQDIVTYLSLTLAAG
ncbi:MAG: acyl carrier protein [Deltaproteobacteria bacterium]|nr:acyl carrier protein [Deltaproteobacteria bacterium]